MPAVVIAVIQYSIILFPCKYCRTCTVTQQRRLQKCINFGARIVVNLKRHDRVTASLRELGWLRVGELVRECDLHFMYNLLHGTNAPDLIRRHITRRADISVRSTRAARDGQLQIPRVRTEFARRSFLCRASREWNGLPAYVRCSPSYSVFKKRLTENRR